MRLILHFLLASFTVLLLTRCKSKEEVAIPVKITSNFVPRLVSLLVTNIHGFPARSYIGEWSFDIFMYSEYLTVNPDGTFEYLDRGCMGKSVSRGKWIDNGKYLILNSYQEYAHYPELYDIEPLPGTKIKKRKNKKDPNDIYYELDHSFTRSISFRMDSTHKYFDGERLVLYHNKLYQLNNFDTLTRWGHTGYLLTKPQLSL
jgi:hypothetical protein